MVSKTDIVIIGENLLGLYTGIKCIEKGYNVVIFEKSLKQSYINFNPILFSENHKHIRKLLSKYESPFIETNNPIYNIDIINTLLNKIEKIPTLLLDNMTFEQLCLNTIGKNNLNILKNKIQYYQHLKNFNSIDAIVYLKKNYINHKHYILKENPFFLLNKLRSHFIKLGGVINYSTSIDNVSILKNNTLCCSYSNNFEINTDIVISTLNKKNLLNIYNWDSNTSSLINSLSSFYDKINDVISHQNIRSHLISEYNIAIPIYNHNTFNNIPIHTQFFGKNIKFFFCSDIFSKNKGWIEGSFDILHDILKLL
jgi:hypothetical protein